MDREEVLELFHRSGALLEGHFLLTSGLHSPQYFQCARVLQYPQYAERLAGEIAQHFFPHDVEVVVSPALGGILVGYEVARHLGCRTIFAERDDTMGGKMTLRRGFEIKPNERTLVVEDVVTTGGSVEEVIELVREVHAELIGVGLLVDRSGGRVDFGVEKFALLELEVTTYAPQQCPLCEAGIPLVKPGSRKPLF